MKHDQRASLAAALRTAIRPVPDFPQPGILFQDLTPVLGDAGLFGRTIDALAEGFAEQGVTRVAAIESRGFIFGAPVAERLRAGFVPIRKVGKLPFRTVSVAYALEYGAATLEMHEDAVRPGDRVLLVDDVLATGGTAAAAVDLVERCGAEVVGAAFVLDIAGIGGADRVAGRLAGRELRCLVSV